MLFQHSDFESPQHLLLQALKLEILKQILLLILLPGLKINLRLIFHSLQIRKTTLMHSYSKPNFKK